MTILSKLFGSLSNIEKELEDIHVSMFQTKLGLPPLEAKGLIRKMLKEAKEESRKEGTQSYLQTLVKYCCKRRPLIKKLRLYCSRKGRKG